MINNSLSIRVGLFLKLARKDKGMTGKELAKLIHVSQQQVSRYERGETSLTLDKVGRILISLNKRWSELFEFIEDDNLEKLIRFTYK